MANALRNYVNTPVPQTEQASPLQAQNNAGGFSFVVDNKVRLERFLILGVDGGTYYVSERDLTKQNVNFIRDMIREDENLVLQTTVDVSDSGRAYRNDAAIFVLALLLCEGKNKAATVAAANKVARIATHVYGLANYIDKLGGWGPAKRKAIANWFTSKTANDLAYQAVKYRQRNGWTLRDLMRLSHPVGVNEQVGNFILGKPYLPTDGFSLNILEDFDSMQRVRSVSDVLIVLDRNRNLPWETIPTQFLTDLKVWKKLFENGQLKGQALLRNITRLAKLGAFNDLIFARQVADALVDENMIRKTRLHPMQYLNAYVVYTEGQGRATGSWGGITRSREWNVSGIIADALDAGFHKAFANIDPANKRTMISVDTSGSMGWYLAGNTQLSCFQGAGAMAMVTARTEPYYIVNSFSTRMNDVGISARDNLKEATRKLQNSFGGGTDCSLPMIHAKENRLEIDTFIVITDNETWAGRMHPHKALEDYRQKMGIPSKLVVMAMTPTQFSIANPLDGGMLDVVGFDSNTPKVLADFSAGRI